MIDTPGAEVALVGGHAKCYGGNVASAGASNPHQGSPDDHDGAGEVAEVVTDQEGGQDIDHPSGTLVVYAQHDDPGVGARRVATDVAEPRSKVTRNLSSRVAASSTSGSSLPPSPSSTTVSTS